MGIFDFNFNFHIRSFSIGLSFNESSPLSLSFSQIYSALFALFNSKNENKQKAVNRIDKINQNNHQIRI